MTENEAVYCLKADSESHSEVCEECDLYGLVGCDHCQNDAIEFAIKALEEVQQYREIGTPEELMRGKRYMNIAKHHGIIGQVIDECVAYEAIGTPDECRKAVEKQAARKATTNHSWTHYHFFCPVCKTEVNDMKYCPNCGQKLDWSEEE